jgi:catechol 2,3-dioxygenase-like lactoylglutathione lyase family enzyme
MIRQLAHVCFFTDQIDAMVAFYRDGLGLPVKFTLHTDDDELMGYYFDCGATTFIEVFDQKLAIKQWGGQVQALKPGSQYKHFCLEVTGLADVKAMLEGRGIQVTAVKLGMDHSLQAWINDPDGNAIELMEYTHASLQLHRPPPAR